MPVGTGPRCHDAAVRRHAVWASLVAGTLLVACSSSAHRTAPKTSTSTTTSTSPRAAGVTTATPETSVPTSAAAPTTATACPVGNGSTAPFRAPPSTASSLLTSVTVTASACGDHVMFGFVEKQGGTPSCDVAYSNGPFVSDASGAAVTVRGAAFLTVRCTPAYGHDFESGRTTYTGPTRIDPSGVRHVRELVETGDFEGVVTWVVGLDTKRPFGVVPVTIPPGVSTVTLTIS